MQEIGIRNSKIYIIHGSTSYNLTTLGCLRSFKAAISLFICNLNQRETHSSMIIKSAFEWSWEKKKEERKFYPFSWKRSKETWLVMFRSMMLFFSMILTAKGWPESVFLANLTLPKLPSPRVLPNSYFPSRILFSFFFASSCFCLMSKLLFSQTALNSLSSHQKQSKTKKLDRSNQSFCFLERQVPILSPSLVSWVTNEEVDETIKDDFMRFPEQGKTAEKISNAIINSQTSCQKIDYALASHSRFTLLRIAY